MFTAVFACEVAIRSIWEQATETNFPYRAYPHHKPGLWVDKFGISSYYTSETRDFLKKFDSYAPEEIRYENTPAYRTHIRPNASSRGQVVVLGVERFIDETEQLSSIPEVVTLLRTSVRSSST
jgi:hypothetical protein